MGVIEIGGHRPRTGMATWIADTATLIGQVVLEDGTSIWYGAILRADGDTMIIGANSNVQDGCVLHTDPNRPLALGSGVSVGHRAVLHGCTVGDDVLIGMSATVMNGARIGAGSLVAAGAVVLEDTEIPERSLVAGVPGKVRRSLTDEEFASIQQNAEIYGTLARQYAREARPA
ncbi:gamma carbonic anhydrase family protein [Actinobacteria bacterium YIM 96077]|uniref:Gamma carbonic anhydrase family protein n=1 Tax=Phytoactinopolyspora halophila TaxID=1981511 RepID=A0A329QS44_9ACTN|nr:gamma carbonic anhydrase family protein [Phytoactinopolyspora halophila]AYY15032.1 gamma carbonic anhydrase family protein [Actinobacteria bacterium YIM 96077]RAW14202.1 gamma carbonic anhydrase family protein [Phytoactinopolyspora halophila]